MKRKRLSHFIYPVCLPKVGTDLINTNESLSLPTFLDQTTAHNALVLPAAITQQITDSSFNDEDGHYGALTAEPYQYY